tara:strand:+ start:658 stop:1827 length:1170 start_codon:yes stop_codon:yes gene_type:complete
MTRRFTQSFSFSGFLLFVGFLIIPTNTNAQNCNAPTGLNTINVSNFSATLNWTLDSNVDHYRLKYQEVGASTWEIITNPTGVSHGISGLIENTTYIWEVRAYCSTDNSEFSSWSDSETFVTTNDPVDCNGDVNGTAFYDSCQNCVGGTTGDIACIDFTPTVSISLSTTECGETADITFMTSQDANEPDIASSVFTSDGGVFDFSELIINDVIGSSSGWAGGGFLNGNMTLMVASILTSDKISVKVVNSSGVQIGIFTIENSVGGILVDATSPGDNNNITSGNSQTILLNGLFVNPSSSEITFTSTIDSELGDQDIQNASVTVTCSPTCPQLGDANCDGIVNLADLTLVINHWLQSTSTGENGDVIGSEDGFVNLSDLTLVINNWLQSTP